MAINLQAAYDRERNKRAELEAQIERLGKVEESARNFLWEWGEGSVEDENQAADELRAALEGGK